MNARVRKLFRRRRRDVIELGKTANENVDALLLKRITNLIEVRRFVFLWTLLFVVLIFAGIYQFRAVEKYYLTLQPAPGGVMREGMVGSFSNANPLYASSSADTAVSKMVFSGLLTYDRKNNLIGNLAEKWEVDATSTTYTLTLRDDVKWHDGKPFSADDVVFTYQKIQDIDARSPLFASWQGITVTKKDTHSVIFKLPNALGSFPYALTNGIVPKHLLENLPSETLRSATFNNNPVGTGPFKWQSLEISGTSTADREQRINLVANKDYFIAKPQLDGFNLRIFPTPQQLTDNFKQGKIIAASGYEKLPNDIDENNVEQHHTPLTGNVMVFFNTASTKFSELPVRKALTQAINRAEVASQIEQSAGVTSGPLLRGQLGYVPGLEQLPYDQAKATAELEAAGWKVGADGVRAKNGVQLTIKLRSQNNPDYIKASQLVQKAWAAIGVKTELNYLNSEDLQSNVITNRDYDALLYGISIGVDPDVFAYWHSTQTSSSGIGRLNLSEYRSQSSDQALEAGRTRNDPALRAPKYKAFLDSWIADAPAVALYRPSYLYVSRLHIHAMPVSSYNSGADRFNTVHLWQIRETKQTK